MLAIKTQSAIIIIFAFSKSSALPANSYHQLLRSQLSDGKNALYFEPETKAQEQIGAKFISPFNKNLTEEWAGARLLQILVPAGEYQDGEKVLSAEQVAQRLENRMEIPANRVNTC